MATLVLSGVGRLVAGPLGGAVGAVLGDALDHRLLGPKARQGARLSDLAVQASEYGAVLPRLFGRTRVAGTVIWATDLKETRTRISQGKGRPKVDTYSYSASFAVALSARPILRVERIWADGSLLRGSAGDWKRDAVMRVHRGGEDQAVDRLIAAAEGLATCPAYRGLAYAVFENLPLGDFGNRVPQLSFEIVADEGPVSAGDIIGGVGGPVFDGYALTARSTGDAARDMARLAPYALVEGAARFAPGTSHDFAETSTATKTMRAAEAGLPARIAVDYAELARDYQAGRQTATRLAGGAGEETVALPAVLGAGGARALADELLARTWRERTRCEARFDLRALAVRPGDLVTLPGDATTWRATASVIEGGGVTLSLIAHGLARVTEGEADGGRAVGEPDVPAGETQLVVVDLPPIGAPVEEPRVAVLANGTSGGWRRAALSVSRDGGASWETLGSTALPATVGTVAVALGTGPAAVVDRVNHIDVALAHAGLLLADADHDALTNGANLAMLGAEALQFGDATPLGAGVWRLTTLWRGRCGTEAAIMGHGTDEPFALLDAAAMRFLPSEDATAGAVLAAQGVGDDAPVARTLGAVGRAARPLSPVGLGASPVDGGIALAWVRRSRDGFVWRDGVDAPLGEEHEAYRIDAAGGGASLSVDRATPDWLLPADFAAAGSPVEVAVRQVGRAGLSDPATIRIIM